MLHNSKSVPHYFDEFLYRYGLQDIMANYTNTSGNIVFSSGLNADAKIKDYASSVAGKADWPVNMFQSKHHANSGSKLANYYTPEIAHKVTTKQMDDFVNFGYPLWDGISSNFRLV